MNPPIPPGDWPRLLALVEQALDLPAEERASWVQGLDLPPELARSLHGLLAERSAVEAGNFLAAMPALSDPQGDAAQTETQSRFAAGTLVGPWRLIRELGEGGMSVVWLAERHDGQLARQVALKLPHAGPGQDRLARRMLRERRILAALEHPHIARLYDVGRTDEGTPYLVMEYVQGTTLLQHADDVNLDLRGRVQLFLQILAAVQYAHAQLVLHRDLKPGNILVATDGAVKLLDFGIAKLMAGDGDTDSHAGTTELTQGHGHRLTPSYASPEQIQGRPLGTASDVYSLGVVLYELLCGLRPHFGAAPGAGSAAQLEAAVLNDEVKPPSRRHPASDLLQARSTTAAALARALRGDLDAIVLKALAREPAQRYTTAEALGADLQRWLNGQAVSARGPGFWYPVGKFVRLHRVGLGLGGLALSVLVASSAVALVQSRMAKQEAERAAAARDFMLQLFDEADPARLKGVELTTAQRLELGRQKAETTLGGQARLQAEVLAGIGEAQLKVGETAGADAALRKAAGFFMAAGDQAREAAARITRLQIAANERDPEAVPALQAELKPLLPVIRRDPGLHTRWLVAQGLAAVALREPTAARKLFEECVALAKLDDPQQNRAAFTAHINLAALLAISGAPLSAQDQLKAAESLQAAHKDLASVERDMELAEARVVLAWHKGGAASIEDLPAAIKRCDAEVGPRHLICGRLKVRLLNAYKVSGETDKMPPLLVDGSWWLNRSASPIVQFSSALALTQAAALQLPINPKAEALAKLEELLKADTRKPLPLATQLPGLVTLAEVHLRLGDRSRAAFWLDRAESLLGSAGAEALFATRHIKLSRGLILQSEGRDREALESMSELCDMPHRGAGNNLTRLNCVRSLVLTGRGADATSVAFAAVEVLTKAIGPDAPNTQRARKLLEALQSPAGWRPPPWDASQIFLAF